MKHLKLHTRTEVKFYLSILIYFLLLVFTADAQLPMKRDDFNGTVRKDWWRYDLEGTALPATVLNGVIMLALPSADNSLPWCNTSLWDGHNMYNNVTLTMRFKGATPARPGSRGGGLWVTTALNQPTENAWFMQVWDDPAYPDYNPQNVWWRASVANMNLMNNPPWLEEVDISADILQWHTYKIVRNRQAANEFIFYIDGAEIYRSQSVRITSQLSVQIWNDNLVYRRDPLSFVRRVWSGGTPDRFILDYVEVLTQPHPGTSLPPATNMLLRELPKEIGSGNADYLWKTYTFTSPAARAAILVTARAERYGSFGEDDDIRLVVDNTDYGWNTAQAFNGESLQGQSKTVLIENTLSSGRHQIRVYGDQTPILFDVTVLAAAHGGILLNDDIETTASGGNNVLFRTYSFLSHAGNISVYVSGTADEDLTPLDYGRYESNFNNSEDDDVRIMIDGTDYGWQNNNAIWGNRLYGESKSILVTANLSEGEHTLRIYTNGTPRLHRVLIYGENDDHSLPVTISSFHATSQTDLNLIEWNTQAEVNNVGFNIFRDTRVSDVPPEQLNFSRLNSLLIQGAGSSSEVHHYKYEDYDLIDSAKYYWYRLENLHFDGSVEEYGVIKLIRAQSTPQEFSMAQNYPNPFNQYTTIMYQLPATSNVELKIYNVTGTLVVQKKLGFQTTGEHRLQWDGKNTADHQLPSGIYFYKITANSESRIKRLLILR